MSEIILYPTETVYALGVNALDQAAWRALCALKGRSDCQPASWLVRDIADIRRYGQVSVSAEKIINQFLPGPLTVVLPAKSSVPLWSQSKAGMVGFRISPDPKAQTLISSYMSEHNAPLTCTSANVHGLAPATEVEVIKKQFGPVSEQITQIVEDGVRECNASTVVMIKANQLEILRSGPVSLQQLQAVL